MLYDRKWDRQVKTVRAKPYRKIFARAANIIEERGHSKYFLEGASGGVCLYGAINVAVCGDPCLVGKGQRAMDMFARIAGFESRSAAVDWNNAPKTSTKQVVRALRKAANS